MYDKSKRVQILCKGIVLVGQIFNWTTTHDTKAYINSLQNINTQRYVCTRAHTQVVFCLYDKL